MYEAEVKPVLPPSGKIVREDDLELFRAAEGCLLAEAETNVMCGPEGCHVAGELVEDAYKKAGGRCTASEGRLVEILQAREQAAHYPDPTFPGAFGLHTLVHFVTEYWRINPEIIKGERETPDMLVDALNLVERALAAMADSQADQSCPGWRDMWRKREAVASETKEADHEQA